MAQKGRFKTATQWLIEQAAKAALRELARAIIRHLWPW
jgi:hypothetical protein